MMIREGSTGGEYTTRRFPPPWSAEETEACYIVAVRECFDRMDGKVT